LLVDQAVQLVAGGRRPRGQAQEGAGSLRRGAGLRPGPQAPRV